MQCFGVKPRVECLLKFRAFAGIWSVLALQYFEVLGQWLQGVGEGTPVLMHLFWTFKVGRARKHWFENETSHVKPHVWAEGHGGMERAGANREKRGTGVSTLEKHMGLGGVWSGWSHENAWQIRMQSMSNYGYNNAWLEYALEWHWQQQHTFTPLARWVLINERFKGS